MSGTPVRQWIAPILIGVMLAWALAASEWRRRTDLDSEATIARAIEARRLLERQVRIRAATKAAILNDAGWPTTISPEWFEGNPPRNPFVSPAHPWIDIAGPDQADLFDPPVRQALTPADAAFWYNPANGVVRARVGPMVTDGRAVELYNRLNGSSVSSLFGVEGTGQYAATPRRLQTSRANRE